MTVSQPSSAVPAAATAAVRRPVAPALAVLSGLWLWLSTFFLPYPFTIHGVDARQRDMAFGLALGLVAVGWLQRARRSPRTLPFVAGCALLSVACISLSLVFSYTAFGPLAIPWWNEKVIGILVLALCAVDAGRTRRRAKR